MGILGRLFGKPQRYSQLNKAESEPTPEPYIWSLYVCRESKTLLFAVHTDSPLCVLGYLIDDFREYGSPQAPWELHLNYNPTNDSFKLESKHFSDNGSGISPALDRVLSDIDPHWERKGRDPVCIDLSSNKFIPMANPSTINEFLSGDMNWEKVSEKKSDDPDSFCSVITQIFEKTSD